MTNSARPPGGRARLSTTVRVGIAFVALCVIAGVLLLFYALSSVVTDPANAPP